MACQDAEGRGNYPLEPSIQDVETWLDWQACQMDMPYWWTELTTIPGVEDPWKLAWKIHASFSILAFRSKVFPGQGYTTPPALKCLTQNVFLPDELSYQDMWQQPFLLTVAYAWGLQYWAERLNLPVDLDFCPLGRSVLELRERVKEHVIFSKQDVIQGLGRIDPGTMSQWPQPTPTDIRSMDSASDEAWEAHVTTSSLFGSIPERRYTTVPSPRLQVEDQPIGPDASLIKAATQTASVTMSGVKLTSPITPLDQMEEEKWYMLVVTTLIRSLNLEMTGVVLGDMVATLSGGSAFQNPHIAAVLSRPIQPRGVISNQGATMKVLGRNDAEWESLMMDQPLTAFGQRDRLMTTFGQRDWNANGQNPWPVFSNLVSNYILNSRNVFLEIGQAFAHCCELP